MSSDYATGGYTPLFLAIKEGHHKIVEVLVQLKADITVTDDRNRSPLELVVLMERVSSVRSLLLAGALVTDSCWKMATRCHSKEITEMIHKKYEEVFGDPSAWDEYDVMAFTAGRRTYSWV